MPSSNVCWGIEIGAGAIKAVKLEGDAQRVNLLDFAYIEHPKVLSTPGVDAGDVLRVSLGQLVGQYDLSKAAIAVSVPGHLAFARFAKLPPVEPKKVPDIVKFEAMQQVPFPLEQVEWDYQTFQAPDSPDVEVGIFAITKERMNERLALLADVGITPNFVTLSPLAAFNGLAYDLEFTEKTPGTIIVDVGTSSTDLVIEDAGRVWVRTFPIGGHHFTEALVNAFKISYSKAEALKKEAESSPHARRVFQEMRPVFTDLGQDIQRSIGYHQNLHKDAKLTRLIGVGATFQLPGLRKFLKQQLGLEVYRVEQFKRVSTDGLKDEARAKKFQEMSLVFATAYGLALQGLGNAAIGANLMPVGVIRKTMWDEKVKWFGLASGLAVAASAAMFIRPVMSYLAVGKATPVAEIDQALNVAQQKSNAANEAGVTQAAPGDMTAANMLALLDDRDIYAHLVRDLGEIFKDADAKARRRPPKGDFVLPDDVPAFTLKAFRTDYGPPMGSSTDEFGGGGDAGGAGASGDSLRRVRVELVISMQRPDKADASSFMLETIRTWLSANADGSKRGTPYRILPNPRIQLVEMQSTGGETPGAEPPPGIGRRGGEGVLPPGGRGAPEGPRGRGGDFAPTAPVGDGGVFQPGGAGGEAASLAPLSKLLPRAVLPGQTFTVTATWEVEILPPAKAEAEQGA
ncbi:MAG: type IV pilus assembly protein PilM [Phycisphaeraceae bacterium]|nr:MAG: type IV pilus assembly protein PilM [Phycisphaeraceae bacterium]